MRRIVFLLFLAACSLSKEVEAQEDAAVKLCTGLLSVDLRDTNYVLHDEYHYNQFKSLFENQNFSSYQQYSDFAAKAGLDIPLVDGILGFSGEAKTNNSTFSQQYQAFKNASFQERADRVKAVTNTSTLNSEYLKVISHCNSDYFGTLANLIKMSVHVVPNSYSSFQVTIQANIPPGFGYLILRQLEPARSVSCTEGGHPVSLQTARPTNRALLTCTKSEKQSLNFQVFSNAGTSRPVLLPARPTAQVATLTSIEPSWTANPPAVGRPLTYPCSCLAVAQNATTKDVVLNNMCLDAVTAVGFKDEPGVTTPPLPLAAVEGRQYTLLNLPKGSTSTLKPGVSGGGVGLFVYSCPGVSAPPVVYWPPVENPAWDMRVAVSPKRRSGSRLLDVTLTVPAPPPGVSPFTSNNINVYGYQVRNGQHANDIQLRSVSGQWNPGNIVQFSIELSDAYFVPESNWNVRFCIGIAGDGCLPSQNLLVGAPQE